MTEGTTFMLCGPTGTNVGYTWESTASLSSSLDDRCLTVQGLAAGTYDFTLRVQTNGNGNGRGRSGSTCTVRVTVLASTAACDITGPTTAGVGQSFQLCGPAGSGVTYDWSGPGLPADSSSQCLNISGVAQGAYTYTLTTTGPDGTNTCSHSVVVGTQAASCAITGGDDVSAGESFQLCGPEGTGVTYDWSGTGLPADSAARCITVSGLSAGTYLYTLVTAGPDSTRTCAKVITVQAVPSTGCAITGPSVVDSAASFTLCGPEGTGLSYDWSGIGLPADSASRCLTVAGLDPGSYLYRLTVTGDSTKTCSWFVTVLGAGGGGDSAMCAGSVRTWRELCAQNDDPGDAWYATLAGVAACIDDRVDAVDWSDDVAGLCDLLDEKGGGLPNRIRRQFAVLLANACAAQLGVRGPDGSRIGIDPSASLSCSRVGIETVSDLLARINELMPTGHDRLRGAARKELARLAWCAARLNRNAGHHCDDDHHDGDHADDESVLARAAEATVGELDVAGDGLQLEIPTPNPFTESTRMRYAVGAGGADVSIGVYDLAGRMIQSLASGRQDAGTYEVRWAGTRSDGTRVEPGIYFVRGTIGSRTLGARIMYLK